VSELAHRYRKKASVRWRTAGGGSRSHPGRKPGKKLEMSLDIDSIKGRVTQKLAERSDDTKKPR
jgi:hypothetical protein